MEIKNEAQYTVKEYRPKKKMVGTRFAPNYTLSPSASATLMEGEGLDDAVTELDGGIMMSTSEIIDFAQGLDSTP
jgi:hypothetical protein